MAVVWGAVVIHVSFFFGLLSELFASLSPIAVMGVMQPDHGLVLCDLPDWCAVSALVTGMTASTVMCGSVE